MFSTIISLIRNSFKMPKFIYCGKIQYYTIPPEEVETNSHISSTIVTEVAKEFDLDKFESMEVDVLDEISKDSKNIKTGLIVNSLGPIEFIQSMEEDTNVGRKMLNNINVTTKKKLKGTSQIGKPKPDPEVLLEGNQQLNRIKKIQFKNKKRKERRKEKATLQLVAGLDNFSLITEKKLEGDKYDFESDFIMT